jgi:lipopolysaccharide transport system permease protein
MGAVARGVELRIIEPRQPGVLERAREAWRYRGLVSFFGARFVQKMYLRTWLGWIWVPLRPTFDFATRVFVFGGVFGVTSTAVPYVLFVLIGMSSWELFERTAYWSTRSLELNRRYLRRLYVPRLTVIAGGFFPAAVVYGVYMVLALLTFGYYAIADGQLYLPLSPSLLLVPVGIVLLVALGLSIGLWLSVYGAQARDVRFVLSYALSFWFFLTPIVIPVTRIPAGFRTVVELNPVTAPVVLVREGLLGSEAVSATSLLATFVALAVIGGSGLWFFTRSEAAALDSL